MSEERGREALADLADLPLERYPHEALLPAVEAFPGSARASTS